jgi:hypothetical protein
MAMSDTEMALMMGANQLAAMRPVNPGAFSGVEAGMMPPGAQMARPTMPMPPTAPTGQMPPSPMPNPMPSGAMSDQEAAMMRAAMPPAGNEPMPMDQEGMMRYIQEKSRQIRERMGSQGSMSNADMGALEAVMAAMPQQQPATQMPRSREVGSGAMTDMEMKRMMSGVR